MLSNHSRAAAIQKSTLAHVKFMLKNGKCFWKCLMQEKIKKKKLNKTSNKLTLMSLV